MYVLKSENGKSKNSTRTTKIEKKSRKIRERDALGSFLRELDEYNNERRKRGECPISYGNMWRFVEVLSDV